MARTRLSAIDWSFVVTKDPEDSKSKRHRRTVRSNAMRDFWRRKKLATKHGAKRGPHYNFTGLAVSTLYKDNILFSDLRVDESERPYWAGETPANRRGEQTQYVDSDPAAMYNNPSSMSTIAQRHVSSEGPMMPFRTSPILSSQSSLGSGVTDPFNALPLGDSQSWDVLYSRKYTRPYSTFALHTQRSSTDQCRVQSYLCRHRRQLLNSYPSKPRSVHNQGLVALRSVRSNTFTLYLDLRCRLP